MHELKERHAREIKAKNDDIAELKDVIQDMKRIYSSEVEALIGEKE